MKANELRIGNLVLLTKDDFKTTKEYRLDGIDIYKLDESECIDIKPIPLTEEWKEKIKDNKFLFIDSQGFVIFKNEYIYSFVFEDYPFIHQFQNLYFALTNEELKII